jgi:hypothetical protein
MYNLNYTQTTLGYKVEEKLYLGVREQKSLNTAGLEHKSSHSSSMHDKTHTRSGVPNNV